MEPWRAGFFYAHQSPAVFTIGSCWWQCHVSARWWVSEAKRSRIAAWSRHGVVLWCSYPVCWVKFLFMNQLTLHLLPQSRPAFTHWWRQPVVSCRWRTAVNPAGYRSGVSCSLCSFQSLIFISFFHLPRSWTGDWSRSAIFKDIPTC